MAINLPALTAATATPADVTPVVVPGGADRWTVVLGPVKATIYYEYDVESDRNWSCVYVDDDLAMLVDPRYAQLAAAEENLGSNRWLTRGADPTIDAFYDDELNSCIGEVKTAIAGAVLPYLRGVLDNHQRMLDGLKFSATAGCTTCKCSPGVVARWVWRHGTRVQINISLTHPTPPGELV